MTLSKEDWSDQAEASVLLLNYAGLAPTAKEPASAAGRNVIVPTGFVIPLDGRPMPSSESRPARTAPSH
jgi:hypothetical protein